jgi:hypothetical protein
MAFLTEAANRGSISTGFDIQYSNKFESDNSEGIQRNYDASTGANCIANNSTTNPKKFTVSCWVKLSELLASGQNIPWIAIAGGYATVVKFQDEQFAVYDDNAGWNLKTTAKFRDIAAWYHLVCAVDTTQSTAANRVNLYVNGVLQTSFATESYGTQNADNQLWRTNTSHTIGASSYFKGGYITEVHCIDGTQYAASDFGEYDEDSGIWKPKEVDVTYGAQGYYMNWSDFASANNNANNTGVGKDHSGNTNPFVNLNNWSSADIATDTPTNNFCTLNPIAYNTTYTATEGNTKWSKSDTTYGLASGTQYVGGGKWYWEIKATDFGTYSSCAFGILDAAKPTLGPSENGYEDPSLDASNPEILAMTGSPNGWVMNSSSTISNNGSTNSVDYTFNEGDILAFALDMDNGGYWMGNSRYSGVANGSFWIAPGGTSTSGSVATTDPSNGNYALVGNGGGTNNGTPNFNGGSITGGSLLTAGFTLVTPLLGVYHSNTTVTLEVNFGGFTSYAENGGYADANGHGNFAYAVPSGFYALCSKNLAEFGG